MHYWGIFGGIWPPMVAVAAVAASLVASGHAILHKRDVRAAVGWVGVAWLVPFAGPALYALLGVNRIQRRAKALQMVRGGFTSRTAHGNSSVPPAPTRSEQAHLEALKRLGDGVVWRPLLAGNRITMLDGGNEAYPAMLQAIEAATSSVAMCTYIFDNDRIGKLFVDALAAAVERGVEVRVLVDAVGSRYSTPPIQWRLRRAGIPHALFLRTLRPGFVTFMNLRNHRKILVTDGTVGFTGGMNVRDDFWSDGGRPAAHDLHFRVEGPVVGHLVECFAEDWAFTTKEVLEGDRWFPPIGRAGNLICRGVSDGPDEDFETLRYMLLGAVTVARRTIRIMTPYFLPDGALITALRVAALRGVQVEILLPAQNNLPFVQWACMGQINQILEHGCRVYLAPPPFDHSKLMMVDGAWSLVGSTNWDPRSLRLNFEFNVEAYGPSLARSLEQWFDVRKKAATPLLPEHVEARSLPVKLRDGIARLLSPYL